MRPMGPECRLSSTHQVGVDDLAVTVALLIGVTSYMMQAHLLENSRLQGNRESALNLKAGRGRRKRKRTLPDSPVPSSRSLTARL